MSEVAPFFALIHGLERLAPYVIYAFLLLACTGCNRDPDAVASQRDVTLPTWPTPVSDVRPYLGISYVNVTPVAESGQPAGALVGRVVAGGPALEAGLHIGDVIFQADGRTLSPEYSLDDAVNAHEPGDDMTLTLWRTGAVLAFSVTLQGAQEYTFSLSPIEHEFKRLGLAVLEVDGGLVVEDVVFGSPAHRAGLEVGDLLVMIDGQTGLYGKALVQVFDALESEPVVAVMVQRGDVQREMTIRVDAGPTPP